MTKIAKIANAINDRAANYEIGRLQDLRRRMKGLRKSSSVIFNVSKPSVNQVEGWAFHTGGREELQFNIGIESNFDRFRFGVAFSLEPSRTAPCIDPLLPKIDRFNEYVRHHGTDLESFRMWVWRKGKMIKPDAAVRPVTDDEIKIHNFIFVGKAVPVASVNINQVLSTFDLLLPLYVFVESGVLEDQSALALGNHLPFEFHEGVTASDCFTSHRKSSDEISVVLRSEKIKLKLYEELKKDIHSKVGQEIRSGSGGRIDLVVAASSGEFDFYEIKPAVLARHAIREALPQLLEYAYRKGGKEARRLVIVSHAPLDLDSEAFLRVLQHKGLPIYYKHVEID